MRATALVFFLALAAAACADSPAAPAPAFALQSGSYFLTLDSRSAASSCTTVSGAPTPVSSARVEARFAGGVWELDATGASSSDLQIRLRERAALYSGSIEGGVHVIDNAIDVAVPTPIESARTDPGSIGGSFRNSNVSYMLLTGVIRCTEGTWKLVPAF